MTAKHALGIDLGTTHCALAHHRLDEDSEQLPQVLPVPQTVSPGEVAARPLLPSFIYLPSEVELPEGALSLPWQPSPGAAVGHFAREQGAKVPARLVSSAKSWLSYSGVDRRAPILPWDAPEGVPRLSPLDASARYLSHLRHAWDLANPNEPLSEQDVVITVPASFDAVARELTAEAARAAGLEERLTLIEEPQAALYSWLVGQGEEWRRQVEV
ncbi:MAG: Hsp70 family protein, partial [Myxococcota bacterium]